MGRRGLRGRGLRGGARALVGVLAVVGPLALAGCTSDGEGGSAPTSIDQVLGTPTPTPTATAPRSPSPVVKPFPRLCPELLRATDVLDALGRDQLPGTSTRVYAGPVAGTQRLERLTCQFGVLPPARPGQPQRVRVEVSTVRYATPQAAVDRLDATADEARGDGKRVQETTLDGRRAYLVSEPTDTYLAVAEGPRTLVVTLSTDLARTPQQALPALQRMARTALFATPSPAAG